MKHHWLLVCAVLAVSFSAGCGSDEPDVGVQGASGRDSSSRSTPNISDEKPAPLILLSESIEPVRYHETYQTDIPITASNAHQVTELLTVGKGALEDIIWSRNGQTLVALGTHSVYVFDATDWNTQPRIFLNALPPIAVSSDGDILAARTADSALVIWESHSGDILGTPILPNNSQLVNLAFSPNDDELAGLDTSGTILRWPSADNYSGHPTESTTDPSVSTSLHFHANGGLFAVGIRENVAVVTDVDQLETVLTFPIPEWYQWYAVTDDGTTIILPLSDETSPNERVVTSYQLFDTLSGEDLGTIPAENYRTAINAAQNIYLSVDQGALEIHDISSHRLLEHFSIIHILRGLDEETYNLDPQVPFIPLSTRQLDLRNVDFSPNGTRIVLSYESGEIIIIHLDSGEAFSIVGAFSAPFYDAWLTPDENTLITAAAHSVDLWDLTTSTGRFGVQRDPSSGFALYNDGTAFAVGENSIMVYDLVSLIPRRPMRSSGRADVIMFDATGSLLAWITDRSGNPRLHIRNLVDDTVPITHIPLEAGQGFVPMMAFSPTGDTIAAVHGNGNLTVWDIATVIPLVQIPFPDTNYQRLTYTPDGGVITLSAGSLPIHVINIATGDDTILTDNGYFVLCMAYSPDGSVLAVGGIESILLLDAASGGILTTLEGFRPYVEQLRFSVDGDYLISASSDGTVQLWGVPQTD